MTFDQWFSNETGDWMCSESTIESYRDIAIRAWKAGRAELKRIQNATVAQGLERHSDKVEVGSSNLPRRTD